jgi:putative effector of murein hydrolase LrgA (UPF0299 family)
MSAVRSLASRLLNALVRRSAPESRSWGLAMLREMDFVEGDWSALCWALGSSMALWRRALSRKARSVKSLTRSALAVLAGLAVAGAVLTVCILVLSGLIHASWFAHADGRLAERLLWIVVPEAVYVVSAAALWRRRTSVALGILTAGVMLMTHAIVHYVTHG